MKFIRRIGILLVIGLIGSSWMLANFDALEEGDQSPMVYPGETWATEKPKEAGMNAAGLDALREYVGGRGCVVRYGRMVYSWGDMSKRADVASAAKAVYAHFLFKAVEDGKISSLDEKLSKWEPRLNAINAELGHKDRNIRWRHAANQISCYGMVEKPGSAFDYNDWQMALFWDTLFLKVYGARKGDASAACRSNSVRR
jgi:hypothetical protein